MAVCRFLAWAVVVAAGAAQRPEPRVGVAAASADQVVCLAADGVPLRSGEPVRLIEPATPSRVLRGRVGKQLPACGAMAQQDFKAPFYEVILDNPPDEPTFLAIALLDDRDPPARVRSCASAEGLHLTLWSGEPLRSARLWHAYWYLGYDVEPDCEPADYQ